MKVIFGTGNPLALEPANILTAAVMPEDIVKEYVLVRASMNPLTAVDIRVDLPRICSMVRGSCVMQMAGFTLVSLRTITAMVRASWFILIKPDMKALL